MHVTIPVLLQDCPHYDRDNQAMRRQWSGEEYDGTDALFHSQYSLENEEVSVFVVVCVCVFVFVFGGGSVG